jgi:uncharacterized phage protein (TIGR02218 family)
MTKSLSNELRAHYALGTTTVARCWKATLTNGNVVAGTSHTEDITFDGVVYRSAVGYNTSDIESSFNLSPDNLELEGVLASPAITDEDIRTGKWDYAAIEFFEVNYADLTMGRNVLRVGTLGEVKGGRSKFTAELRGLTQKLSRRIIKLTTKDCQHDLGDSRCQVNLASHTVTGSVTSGITNNRQFTDSVRTETTDRFTGGKITWLTGANAGLSMEVKRSTAAGLIELHEQMPYTIIVGDTYSMYTGCKKRLTEDCIATFNNAVNFGGFPHLPLSDVYNGPASVRGG